MSLPISSASYSSSYEIPYSTRFDGSADYMHRTPGTAGNRKTWTFSCWAKWSKGQPYIFSAASDLNNRTSLSQNGSGLWQIVDVSGGTTRVNKQTTAIYRDPAAWSHLVLTFNNGTINFYVNGVEVTSWAVNTNTLGSGDTQVHNTVLHVIGDNAVGPAVGNGWNGYITETVLVDGLALDPTYFGEFDAVTGSWKPKKPEVSNYGTNGFWLDMTDTANLGNDAAGSNDFTLVSLSAADSTVDSPTHNYCTLNPLSGTSTASPAVVTYTKGNLYATNSSASYANHPATMKIPETGKWAFKAWFRGPTISGAGNDQSIGLIYHGATSLIDYAFRIEGYSGDTFQPGNTVVDNGSALSVNDYVEFLIDRDAATCILKVNGTTRYTATGISTADIYPGFNIYNNQVEFDFGQAGYVPSDSSYKPLCTENLTSPAIKSPSKHMDVFTYSGDGNASRSFTLDFQPDFVWIKVRNATYSHNLFDSVRGPLKVMRSNGTTGEGFTAGTDGDLTSFNSNGFTIRQTANYLLNNVSNNYVAWCWKAGSTSSANTSGTITSQVSVNPSAGFSVVTWTGTGSAGTIGHGLGAIPSLIITGRRAGPGDGNWTTYHSSIGATKALFLNLADAETTSAAYWNNTTPTSTVFSVGTNRSSSVSDTYVGYCWAEIPGFSKFGKYTGNGLADGPFVYCGFRPRFVLIKNITVSNPWVIIDTSRDVYNAAGKDLQPHMSSIEDSVGGASDLDITSTGFKIRVTTSGFNTSGNTYIFAAFAEYPLGGDTISEGTAR